MCSLGGSGNMQLKNLFSHHFFTYSMKMTACWQVPAFWQRYLLETLSREFRSGVPWEDLYAGDLVIIAESLEECVRRLLTWKEAMEKKELRVNAGKTKIMICGLGLDLLQSSGEFPCTVCRLEWAATASSAMAASTGCTRSAVSSSA